MVRLLIILLAAVVLGLESVGETNSFAPIPAKGLENFFRLAPDIYSGSSPEGREGFKELARRGIKTIISVDGSKPDVEGAREYGFRYIHLPIGYDGLRRAQANALVKAAIVSPGPIYVHCHHGQHRGPAAAAIICEGARDWSTNQALAWMEAAGTSKDYPGLFKAAAEFSPPRPEELDRISTNFPEQVTVSGLVDAMVEIDTRWAHLGQLRKAGFGQVPTHPDLVASRESLLFAEAWRELIRSGDGQKHGADFTARLEEAERLSWELLEMLDGKTDRSALPATWTALGQSCAACHKKYRN